MNLNRNTTGALGTIGMIAGMIALAITMLYGYVVNIVQLVVSNESIGMLLLRVCGVLVAPLGSILGLFF